MKLVKMPPKGIPAMTGDEPGRAYAHLYKVGASGPLELSSVVLMVYNPWSTPIPGDVNAIVGPVKTDMGKRHFAVAWDAPPDAPR